MGFLSQVFDAAKEKWRWIPGNPIQGVKKPPGSKPNPKAVPQDRIDRMVAELGTAHKQREVALGFLLACECAMRPWEMLGLTKDQVFWRDCYAHLDKTKNGDERDVPLSPGAIEVLAELDAMNPGDKFFTVAEGSVTSFWTEARKRAGFPKGFHFRHSRRVGIKRLSTRLPLLDLARAVGHRDLNSLRHYYHESAAAMALRLQTTPLPPQPASEDAPPPNDV
jgi:integrase